MVFWFGISFLKSQQVPKKAKLPWPTKAAMTQIYEQHLWGGKGHDFYSGSGSHDQEITTPYLNAVSSFLQAHDTPLRVCDLGCGDFNIGRELLKYSSAYNAVDIVEALINRNMQYYKAPHLKFHCLDIAKDQLPKADCIILRQVLQHLSNSEIKEVVFKLKAYPYVLLTEHLPENNFTPNLDIISGQGIRLKHHSGVDILKAPFNFKIKAQRLLNTCVLAPGKGCIVTKLYEVF